MAPARWSSRILHFRDQPPRFRSSRRTPHPHLHGRAERRAFAHRQQRPVRLSSRSAPLQTLQALATGDATAALVTVTSSSA
jgi:hypothetical protein